MKEITRTPQSGPAKKDRNLTRWLFVAPAMLVVLCLLVYPLCSTLPVQRYQQDLDKVNIRIQRDRQLHKNLYGSCIRQGVLNDTGLDFLQSHRSDSDRFLCRTGSEPHQQSHSTPHLPHMYDHPLGVSLHCYRTGMEMDAQRHSGLYPHYADEAGLVRWGCCNS